MDPVLMNARRSIAEGLRLKEQGHYAQAVPLVTDAMSRLRERFGPIHPDIGRCLELLGGIYWRQGNYAEAKRLLIQAVCDQERALGKTHWGVANPLITLANFHAHQGDLTRAERLYLRAIQIREEAFGRSHPQVAKVLNNLAHLHERALSDKAAKALYERARRILEAAPGEHHRHVAASLAGLANISMREGQLQRAENLYSEALALQEREFGPNHPSVVQSLNDLARSLTAQKRLDEALPLIARALALREEHVKRELRSLPEAPMTRVLSTLRIDEEALFRLVRADLANVRLQRLALSATVHRKGRALQESALNFRTIHQGAADKNLLLSFALLSAMREKISEAMHANTTPYLESDQSPRSAAPRSWIGVESIQNRIDVHRRKEKSARKVNSRYFWLPSEDPATDSALCDICALRELEKQLASRRSTFQTDYQFSTRSGLRVFKQPGESDWNRTQRLIELTEYIEEKIAKQSASIRASTATDDDPSKLLSQIAKRLAPGSALIEFVTYTDEPIVPRADDPLGRQRRMYLALVLFPNGSTSALDLGPTAPIDAAIHAMHQAMDTKGEAYLVPTQTLYDLIFRPLEETLGGRRRLFVSPEGPLALVPFAALHDRQQFLVDRFDITYLISGKDLLTSREDIAPARSVSVLAAPTLGSAWAALPGARDEANAIQKLLPQAKLILGRDATKQALKSMAPPGILHIATHAFSMSSAPRPEKARAAVGFGMGSDGASPRWTFDHPQLRAALVLASPPPPDTTAGSTPPEDAWVTPMELSGLNLWRTQLVVLSACDTGRGDVLYGQGIYGLRRALVIAGAQTVVTSLWKVNDETTRHLMELYYRGLLEGQGRVTALHSAMKTLRQTHPHPAHWAPFIAIGQDGPLQGVGPFQQNRASPSPEPCTHMPARGTGSCCARGSATAE
ncbi:CHAT domain-containing protein [Archangium primigenium]|uniref:CHAT domain-containing protein n=1 Tax=[Archangium] primigenium TaxID=2792470 RepID=UPI0019583445|nr:CHAT domain-containing tetratricopeptide repeat protein [Archangium primigenium]